MIASVPDLFFTFISACDLCKKCRISFQMINIKDHKSNGRNEKFAEFKKFKI